MAKKIAMPVSKIIVVHDIGHGYLLCKIAKRKGRKAIVKDMGGYSVKVKEQFKIGYADSKLVSQNDLFLLEAKQLKS